MRQQPHAELDQLIRESRAIVARMRKQLGNPEDFDFMIRNALKGFLAGHDRKAVAFTMRAIFGDH